MPLTHFALGVATGFGAALAIGFAHLARKAETAHVQDKAAAVHTAAIMDAAAKGDDKSMSALVEDMDLAMAREALAAADDLISGRVDPRTAMRSFGLPETDIDNIIASGILDTLIDKPDE